MSKKGQTYKKRFGEYLEGTEVKGEPTDNDAVLAGYAEVHKERESVEEAAIKVYEKLDREI